MGYHLAAVSLALGTMDEGIDGPEVSIGAEGSVGRTNKMAQQGKEMVCEGA